MSTLRSRLYHGETEFDFIGRTRLWFTISGVAVLIAVVALFARHLNLGIEFEGGVVWEFPAGQVTVGQVQDLMDSQGLGQATIQTLSGSDGEKIRVQVGPQSVETSQQVRNALADVAQLSPDEVQFTSVGPSWGDEVTRSAIKAMIVFFVVVSLYITVRFEWAMALASLVAVIHDVVISVGVYALFQFTVTPATVVAFLTILGYSLYDTIVVFDKVHENDRLAEGGRMTYGDMVNVSLNQTLMRSLNTTIAALLPVLSILVVGSWFLGVVALEDFAIALLVGMASGAYSSIFIAAPILALIKGRQPKYRQLAAHVQSRRSAEAATPVEAAVDADGEPVAVATGVAAAPGTARRPPSGGAIPPRPRKQRRRR